MEDEEHDLAVAQFMSITGASHAVAIKYLEDAEGNMEVAIENYNETSEDFEQPKMKVSSGAAPGKKENDYYAGGHSSGIAVQGAGEDEDDFRNTFFESARKAGAKSVGEVDSEKPAMKTFVGQGYTLGDNEKSSRALGVPLAQQKEDEPQALKVTITFWKDGFTVEHGDVPPVLRRIDDPANKPFLDDVMAGRIPPEIHAIARVAKAEVDAHLIDRRGEEYVPPKKTVKAFSGAGNRLGSPTGPVAPATASSSTASAAAAPPAAKPAAPAQSFADASLPQTKLQIRLGDGTRLVAHFNETQTVADVRRFIDASSPQARKYVLVTYPNKEIADESVTLAAGGLLNAVIVQKYK